MVRPNPLLKLLATSALLCLSGCQTAASSNVIEDSRPATGPVAGRIHHLEGEGLVLRVGSNQVTLAPHETRFTVDPGRGPASVDIARQPAGQMCVVDNLAGHGVDYTVSIYCESFVTRPVAVELNAARIEPRIDRIFAPIRVGDDARQIHGLIDTGSAGVVLNAFQVFPPSILSRDGFHFPPGSRRISYNGIIITDVVIEKKYGGHGDKAHSSKGNLGFAQITFGKDGQVVTGLVPVLFAYAAGNDKGYHPFAPTNSTANIIGINADVNALKDPEDDGANGNKAPRTAVVCDERVVTDCGLSSPFRKLAFATGIGQGFLLNRVSMSDCPLSQLEHCPLDRLLTVGLTDNMSSGFARVYARCRGGIIGNRGPLNVCSQIIGNATISADGYQYHSSVMFDSGNPKTIINVPRGASFDATLADNAILRFAIGPDTVYSSRVGDIGTDRIVINQDMNIRTCVGIAFFERHAMFMNYDNGMIGLR